ncbi:MAG TPA: TerB family tellurite resistance protein [Albitalea sp.]
MPKTSLFTRSYPRDSPQAAGRLVALALISNGEIKASEWAMLYELQAREQLGLSGLEWHDIVDGLCAELLATAREHAECRIDGATLARWFAEVVHPDLRRLVLHLSAELIAADGHVEEGESVVLRGAIEHWVLPDDDQARYTPMLYGLDFQVQPRPTARLAGAC